MLPALSWKNPPMRPVPWSAHRPRHTSGRVVTQNQTLGPPKPASHWSGRAASSSQQPLLIGGVSGSLGKEVGTSDVTVLHCEPAKVKGNSG